METHRPQSKRSENDVEIKQNKQELAPSSSSPSHEFSFTISLHHSSTIHDPPPPNSHLAVDLSPADDIFFHGHLIPLHLLSHHHQYFPSSPRFSTNSIDSFTLPIRDLLQDDDDNNTNSGNISKREDSNIRGTTTKELENKSKPSSFSLFGRGLTRGRREGYQEKEEDKEKQQQNTKKVGHDVMHALKRYLRMVLFRGGIKRRDQKNNGLFHGQAAAYSRSGNLMRKNKPQQVRGRRRGECTSAPASMRTSPTNSGLLLATTHLPPSNDSTMEELHAAIQAAIAHCKNSIAKDQDKLLIN